MKEKCKDCGRPQCICITKEQFIELTITWFKKYSCVNSKLLQVYATFYNKYWKTEKAAVFTDLSCDRCIWTAIRESMAKVVSEGLFCNKCNKQICECISASTPVLVSKEETIVEPIPLESLSETFTETINKIEDEIIEDKGTNPGRNSRKKTKTK